MIHKICSHIVDIMALNLLTTYFSDSTDLSNALHQVSDDVYNLKILTASQFSVILVMWSAAVNQADNDSSSDDTNSGRCQ